MILTIAGVHNEWGGDDLSPYVDRLEGNFEIQSALGLRMDTLNATLWDARRILNVPMRAEIIVYDYPGVLDPGGIPQTWHRGQAPIVDPPASPSSSWTPRLFGGYVSQPKYSVVGFQRQVVIAAQDYTVRIKQTVCNRAYSPNATHPSGWTDAQIVKDIFMSYLPDIDTSLVVSALTPGTYMPNISFPVHTVEQFLARVVQVSAAVYRIDYYKRLNYGALGGQTAPFAISDSPNNSTSYGAEKITFAPDWSSLFDRIWIVGANYTGTVQTYTLSPKPDGSGFAFPLPSPLQNVRAATVTVNGVDQGTIGVLGIDGTLDNQAGFKYAVLIGGGQGTSANSGIPTIAFQTTPPANATVVVNGAFVYPLIQIVSDPTLVASLGGLYFEKVLHDRRIQDQTLAQQAGVAQIHAQGYSKNGGGFTCYMRGLNGQLLQPGQSISITHAALFTGLLANPTATGSTFLINRITLRLTDDTIQPYAVDVEYADRPDKGDEDVFDQAIGEQGRVNAAVTQTDVYDIVDDVQLLTDGVGMTDSAAGSTITVAPNWDTALFGYSRWQ